MGQFKEIFKILLVLQILSHVFASHRHPDAEIIDFGIDSSRDQSIIDAAIRRGMDGESVAELLRTKQPVVKVVTSPSGLTKTTTYKLEDDGSISSKTITQSRTRYTYNTGAIPSSIPIDDLRSSPSGTVNRIFYDENGNRVEQTISIDKPKPSTFLDSGDLSGDWLKNPFPNWQLESQFPSLRRTYPEYVEPITTSSQATPASNYHRTITTTYTAPNGEKRITQTSSTNPDDTNSQFPSINSDSWPGFDFNPWGSSDTEDENPDVEVTTKHKFDSWTPKTWNWPEFPTTTTAKPKISYEPELTSRNDLPSLEDFLKSQYGPTTTTRIPTTTTVKPNTTPKTPTTKYKTNTASATKKPIHINIEDLPVTEILHNGKPADESILKNLPPSLKPKLNTGNIFEIENKHRLDEDKDVNVITPKKETNIRTYSSTVSGSERPTIKDLDQEMQDALKRAGISPEEIASSNGDTIYKTRTEPDGRTVTTTYKVKTLPSVAQTSFEETIPVLHNSPKETTPIATSHSYMPYKPAPLIPFSSHISPISEFLSKLGLTKFDILSKNGQLTKTFIDEDGDILTATFVLSSSIKKRSLPA